MKYLVIVESPTKARTISKFLGADYEIRASMGHVMDLPKSVLGVDVDHDFAPEYKVVDDKKKIISDLKSAAKAADAIILATDPDREGEAIAAHVAELLQKTENRRQKTEKMKRIVFHEITKEAIEEALKNPRTIDNNLVDAQTARRVLDRLVGYKLSPLLWQKVRRGLSAGRVQSIALRLIVEREREIKKFEKEGYWTINVFFQNTQKTQSAGVSENQSIRKSESEVSELPIHRNSDTLSIPSFPKTEFELIEINGEKIEVQSSFQLYDGVYKVSKTSIDNEKKAREIEEDLKTRQFAISDVIKRETKRSPQPPFTTSTLQQEAARRFGFVGKRTMTLAQKLYEEGFITYHRTDSVEISMSAMQGIRTFVKKEYGDKYLPGKPRFYTTKQKLAQEAHEAIRPTGLNNQQTTINKQLDRDAAKLYEVIWRRAVASQMTDALIESTTVLVDTIQNTQKTQSAGVSENQSIRKSESDALSILSFPEYRLKANGSVLVFEGFLKVNPQALQDKKLSEFKASERLDLLAIDAEKHETAAPPRYNDASIIKALEEKGIGRPSTYASIISTIESRQYIERTEGKFIPTAVGAAVNDFLVTNFSDIDDIPFTAQMEDELDQIAQGQKEWKPMIAEFYNPFSIKLEEVKDAKRVQIEVEKTDEICEKCGSPMVVRIGKFGKFLSCSKFPECKFSKPFIQETKFICPKDGGKIIVKKTKKGRTFYGCSNYPKCDFAAWKLEDIKSNSKLKT